MELELPLGDSEAGELARRRLQHLAEAAGMDSQAVARLSRAFPSLALVYAAPESRLREVVGPVAAARIRWFLDAPLHTGLVAPAPPSLSRAA